MIVALLMLSLLAASMAIGMALLGLSAGLFVLSMLIGAMQIFMTLFSFCSSLLTLVALLNGILPGASLDSISGLYNNSTTLMTAIKLAQQIMV